MANALTPGVQRIQSGHTKTDSICLHGRGAVGGVWGDHPLSHACGARHATQSPMLRIRSCDNQHAPQEGQPAEADSLRFGLLWSHVRAPVTGHGQHRAAQMRCFATPTQMRAVQQTQHRSARRAQPTHGRKTGAPIQQCRNSSAHTSTDDARACRGWRPQARLGRKPEARRTRVTARNKIARTHRGKSAHMFPAIGPLSPDSTTTGSARRPLGSIHSTRTHMHPRIPRLRWAHTV
jgi:hypothetical protein